LHFKQIYFILADFKFIQILAGIFVIEFQAGNGRGLKNRGILSPYLLTFKELRNRF
jgi:hypothetical protein